MALLFWAHYGWRHGVLGRGGHTWGCFSILCRWRRQWVLPGPKKTLQRFPGTHTGSQLGTRHHLLEGWTTELVCCQLWSFSMLLFILILCLPYSRPLSPLLPSFLKNGLNWMWAFFRYRVWNIPLDRNGIRSRSIWGSIAQWLLAQPLGPDSSSQLFTGCAIWDKLPSLCL